MNLVPPATSLLSSVVQKPKISVILLIFMSGLFLMASMNALCQEDSKTQYSTPIKHYAHSFSPTIRDYLHKTLVLALQASEPDYGKFEIQIYTKHLPANRAKIETERGILLDILFATRWTGRYVNPDNVEAIHFPVLNGMLGLRELVVAEHRENTFKSIKSKKEFNRLSAGQGQGWEDIKILSHNSVETVEAQRYDALFPMLKTGRYDYLPLSVLEVDLTLASLTPQYQSLNKSRSLSIFYPMPIFLFVNKNRRDLVERINHGLSIAISNGSIDQLFAEHFGPVDSQIFEHSKNLVVMVNPFLDQELNTKISDQFFKKYQFQFNLLK